MPSIDVAERLSDKLISALRTGNPIELRLLYAADAVLISPAHLRIQDRTPDVSRHLERLATRLRLVDSRSPTYRTGCNTVVVYGDAKFAGRQGGRTQTFWMRYSRVFEHRNGGWLVTLDHMSRTPEPTAKATLKSVPVTTKRVRRSENRANPSVRGSRDRAQLSALVEALTPGARATPQVRGITMRAVRGSSEPVVIPPQPQLVHAPERNVSAVGRQANALKASQPKRSPKTAKRSRRKASAWMNEIQGFPASDR